MSEWWTYRPSDFLLFSQHTYYRLFELYNTAIWPLHILSLALGIAILLLVWWKPPWQGRVITAILAACWLWVAYAYHLQRYATINWAATYFSAGFTIQAALLIWTGIFRGRLTYQGVPTALKRSGLGIFLFALILQPFATLAFGRNWHQSEVFGIAPDPTVIATLGLLLLTYGNTFWGLLIIPVLWCVISAVTLWTMESPDTFIVLFAMLVAIVFAVWKTTLMRKLN
ncbi:MAG: DUF6064 family protein [Gammaproteobacteria bacterium]|nr:DUF6064 family protein [Gammaproteobacteria bacterium]